MTKATRSWFYFGASATVLGASAILTGMTAHPAATEMASTFKFSNRALAAKDMLRDELNRRFTDRQNVDFGMSRVIRNGARMHYIGPTMNRAGMSEKAETRKNKDGKYEVLLDGVWIGLNHLKPRMQAENDREANAFLAFGDGKVDVAIYTVGGLQYDRGEKADADPRFVDVHDENRNLFQWQGSMGMRAKGPAYVSQKSNLAPRAWEIVEFGRKAWASGKADFSADGPDGWVLFAHRVDAPDESCARCHAPRPNPGDAEQAPAMKAGDKVGLFVIALKNH
ncbi:MAG TPA: hypothetical protein VJ835_10730 [Fimbriimonadaceae bacterium]|nr:hypothetical protein [Fimbriimonadaceae bacterium]